MAKNFTQGINIAGITLTRLARSTYEQRLEDGTKRLFIKYRIANKQRVCWRYTEPFTEKPEQESEKRFLTLTEAVMAANKIN